MSTTPATAVETPPLPPVSAKPVAVIDIGTTSIRMVIAEIREDGDVRTLEALAQAVNLGKDTFTRGRISKSTIEECVRVLKSYRRLLAEYQITRPSQMRVVATSAVREAENRLAFIDRVYVATGIEVDPIDEAEVNRITYLGIEPFLNDEPQLAASNTIVIEVGGGSTELLLVQNGNVAYSHTYRLGSLRLRETLEAYRAPELKVRKIMETQIRRTMDQVRRHVPQDRPVEVIALGGDVRFVASQVNPDWRRDGIVRVPVSQLERFTDRMLELTDDKIVRKYHLTYPDAETLGPALLAYVELAHTFKLDSILVTDVNLRDGLLSEMSRSKGWTDAFSNQIARSALELGRKYQFDEAHAQHVSNLSAGLYDQLKNEHQLEGRFRLLLSIAGLLHECGLFIGSRSYHKHSMYLIQNSELFGLTEKDLMMVALVARYHRRSSPRTTHPGYNSLDHEDRIAVAKMAGLLRVAIALDDSRSQRIQEIRCEQEEGRLVISVPYVDDLSLEQLALKQSGSLFEEIFGMQLLLRTVRP